MAGIQCAHCGGSHDGVAAVRGCWRASQESTRVAAAAPAPVSTSSHVHGSGRPAVHLGRGVIVSPGQPPPEPWRGCTRVRFGPGAAVAEQLEELEGCYFERRPVIVELDGDWSGPGDETVDVPPWSLTAGFTFPGERLRSALGNCLDSRSEGELRWAPAELALDGGATAGGPADVLLPDGTPAYCDAGPLQYMEALPAGGRTAVVVHRIALEHGSLQPFHTNLPPAELAPDQQAAVTHTGGSARIIAPAGSGKTHVLTERTRHLLRAWRIPPQALCLVAFNKRAAQQMRDRTADLPGLQIRSLNALGLSVLSGSGRFGDGRPVETVDERGVRSILESLVKFGRRTNTDPAAAWIEALASVRLGLRAPEEVEADFGGDVQGLPEVFERYRTVLGERGVVDFDEQIYRAIEILLTDAGARHRARPACRVMLVDEFQDLTPAHMLLIRLLAGPSGAVFGVGDDDQTIYGYAGASPDWLIDYQSFFPGSGRHALSVNYRCPPAVVHAAGTLLTHNRRRVPKQVRSERDVPDGDLAVRVSEDPVSTTVDAVLALLDQGASPTAVAVLTRVNNSLAPIQLVLADKSVPVNQAVNTAFLDRTGVRAALGWMRLAANAGRLSGRDVALTARRPPRGLSPKVIEWMSEQRTPGRLRSLADRLSDRDAAKIYSYVEDVELLAAVSAEGDSEQVLTALRDQVGLGQSMERLDGQRRRLDRSPQTDDIDVLVAVGRLHTDPQGFEQWLRKGLSAPGDPHGVTLATIHAVKGREWDHVVVHDATSGLLPHRLATDEEEERRVFHVGLTRGRKSVTVVAGAPPSVFLEEMRQAWVPPPSSTHAADIAGGEGTAGSLSSGSGRAAGAAPSEAESRLRQWRLELARVSGKPAFTILHDKTLRAIVAGGCRTLDELAAIPGIGPAKLDAYGEQILAVLDGSAASEPDAADPLTFI